MPRGLPRAFPGDTESPGRLAELEGSRRLNDVLVAARDYAEQHSKFQAGLVGRHPELAQKLRVCFVARKGTLHEADLDHCRTSSR